MTKAEQFRENAEEAMQLCRQSRTEDAKKVLTELAFTWTQAAALSERKSVGPPAPRAMRSLCAPCTPHGAVGDP
jgi:hypothetical protein